MSVLLRIEQLRLPPGQRLLLEDISWRQFEEILLELGDHRATRIAYDRGTLEIRMPLPEHEKSKVILGDLVKALLDELERDYVSFGSSTFKREERAGGVEPDDCFYIRHFSSMVGKQRLDLTKDPPPDLAIEVDVTSTTQLQAYRALGVPELWRFQAGQLRIDILQAGQYVQSDESLAFAGLPLVEALPRFMAMADELGPRVALKAFRQWFQER